jgi:hypothetical protein
VLDIKEEVEGHADADEDDEWKPFFPWLAR